MSDFDKPLERTGRSRMHLRRKKDSDAFVVLVSLAGRSWDPYPFILLNLAFSTQASYSAPLILLAQNRQDDRDRVIAEQDRQRAERNLADTEYLTREIAGLRMSMGDVATRDFVRSELRVALEEFDRDREGRLAERDQRIAELQAELDELKAEREEP